MTEQLYQILQIIAISAGISYTIFKLLRTSLRNNCDKIVCENNIRNYLRENQYESTRVDILIIKKDLNEIKDILMEQIKIIRDISVTVQELSFMVKNHEQRLQKLEAQK